MRPSRVKINSGETPNLTPNPPTPCGGLHAHRFGNVEQLAVWQVVGAIDETLKGLCIDCLVDLLGQNSDNRVTSHCIATMSVFLLTRCLWEKGRCSCNQ